jgi:membrane protein DedA with SNARE-associated domain
MRALLIVAVALFLIAAVSAFTVSVNVNEHGFIALGLAAFAGSYLADHYGFDIGGRGGRPLAARGTRRSRLDPRA